MEKRGLSQEGLKLIACITMLIDHIGATILPMMELRIIGRIAFPIYCFLLAEGSRRTSNPRRYGLRLAIGALLSELPFDLALVGFSTWRMQSVMLTLLMGFFALEGMKKCSNLLLKVIVVLPFALLAEWMNTDYGAMGVALIAVFAICRDLPHGQILCLLGVAMVLYQMPSASLQITRTFRLSVEMFGLLALVPIHFYCGRKATSGKVIQWCFYLFYPVHLMVLFLIREGL